MKHLKLFFALFAMLALGVGNAWGAEASLSSISTKNVVTTKGQSVSTTFGDVTCKVTRNSGNQPGFYTSSGIVRYYSGDVMTLSVPSGNIITKVVFTMNSGNVGTVDVGTVSDNTWTGNAESISFTGTATVKITKIVVTYETTSGGQTPEPDPENPNPGTGGESLTYTWDLSTASYSAASADQVTWSSTDVSMVVDKDNSTTNANNYLPTTRTSSRFYKSSKLTITPEANVTIISVVFTATSTSYASALSGSTWVNATATASSSTVTVTPTNGTAAISATIGGTCGFTGVTVNYTKTNSGTGETVLSVTPENITWKGIAASAEKSEEITVTLSNIETVTATLSGDNPSAFSIDKNLLEASGKIVVSKNITTIGTYAAILTITDADTQTKTVTLSMEVVADPEPTGTFEKFTGTLEEGDYVLVANGTTDALKNNITSYRFDCGTVEVAEDKIVNPDKSVIWHIAANDKYWTMYNESTKKYAGGTTSKNQGALLDDVKDLAKWTITVDDQGVYTFENYGRSQQSTDANNKFLSKNNQNAYWATYASGQKNPVLYKKSDGKQPAGLVYETNKYRTKLGDSFATPTLTNPNSLNVTYSSSNNDVAEVATDGSVTIKAVGGVEITATFAGSETHRQGSAKYTICVTEHAGTEADPYSVADARRVIDVMETAEGVYATGIVSEIVTAYNSEYGNITYNISVDGTTTGDQLQAYRGKGVNGENFASADDVKVGDEVVIKGNLKLHNGSVYEFDANNELVSRVRNKAQADLAYAETELTANVGEEFTEPTLTNPYSLSITYSSSNTTLATVNATTGEVTILAAGKVTITASTTGNDSYAAGSASYNITITDPSLAVATLPFYFTGKQADIEGTPGMTQSGIDSKDYADAPYLKMNTTGDWLIIRFDSEPSKLSYDIKNNTFSGGTFSVQESADGETYTDVKVHTEITETQSEEHTLLSTSRYVKFIYTEKVNGNVGLGNITISKPDNRQETGLAWNPETVTLTIGDAFTAPTLSNPHSVSGITYESSNEAVAAVSAEGVIALVDDAVGTATITATFDGDATYKPATVTCTIQVKSVPEDCDGSDDFADDQSEEDATYYATRTTIAGWVATNAARITIDDDTYFAINGKTSAVGTITSPVLNGGIGSIKIRYANTYNEDNGVSFRLDIKQNDEVVRTYTITKANSEVVKGTVYTELIEDIKVEGDFVMVFTNLHPSNNSEKNKDRVSIGRLCWTGYEEAPQEPTEETIELYDFAWEISDGSLVMSADWNETPVYVEIYNAGETLETGTYNAFLNLGGWAEASIDKADASVELFIWENGAGADMTGTFVGETTGTKYNLSLTGTMPSGSGEATEYNIEESNVQGVINSEGNLVLQGETATIMLYAFDPTITEPTAYEAEVMYNDYSAYAYGIVMAVTDGTNVEVNGEGLEGEDMTGSAIINAYFVGTILQDGAAVDVEVSDLVVMSDEDLQIAMLSGTGQHLTLGNLTFELYLSNYTGDNGEYQLTSESMVYYPYRGMSREAAITGSITKSYSSELNTDVYTGTVTTTIDEQVYEINLTMYYIEPEAVDMTVTNATITLEEGTLFIEGEWNTYPFIIWLDEWSEGKQYQNINIEVGEWGANYYGMLMQDPTKELAITVENNTLTFKGYFIKGDNQQLHNVTISGTMPQTVTEITLTEGDNSSALATTGVVTVTVNRSFEQGNLYTIALPFTINNAASVFGNGTVVYNFANLAYDKTKEEYILGFTTVSKIEAGKPYLIEPGQDVSSFVAENVTLSPATSISQKVTVDKVEKTATMTAVLSKTTTGGSYWLAEDRYLYNGKVDMPALRALFVLPTTPSGMPARARVALKEDAATGVEDLFTTDAPVKVIVNGQLIIIRDGEMYNVQGQLVK